MEESEAQRGRAVGNFQLFYSAVTYAILKELRSISCVAEMMYGNYSATIQLIGVLPIA